MIKKQVQEWEQQWKKDFEAASQEVDNAMTAKHVSELMVAIKKTGKLFGKNVEEIQDLAHQALLSILEPNPDLIIKKRGYEEDFWYKGYRVLRLHTQTMLFEHMDSPLNRISKEEMEKSLEEIKEEQVKRKQDIEFLSKVLENPELIKDDAFLKEYEVNHAGDTAISALKGYLQKKLAYRSILKDEVRTNIRMKLELKEDKLKYEEDRMEKLSLRIAEYEEEMERCLEAEAFVLSFLKENQIHSTESRFVFTKEDN